MNRRQWLKKCGAAGALYLLSPSLINSSQAEIYDSGKTMNGLSFIAQELVNETNAVLKKSGKPSAFKARAIPPDFQPFTVSALGNFPYYWQDPRNLEFNSKTYRWIASNLKANKSPVQLGSLFTNIYITALSKITYSLSTADTAKLNKIYSNITNQQLGLLNAWKSAFGSLPIGAEPINLIFQIITQKWASPPTTLDQLQKTANLTDILNQIPPNGNSVLPALANYLNALGSDISLVNAAPMNNGYVENALAAVQQPTGENGGLKLNDNSLVPAFNVATPLSEILKSLNSTKTEKSFTYKMSVKRASSENYLVSSADSPKQSDTKTRASSLLKATLENGDDLIRSDIAVDSTPLEVNVNFDGITVVYFGPVSFSMATSTNWYWTDPISDAISNSGKDVSGFKFSPDPNIDFSDTGPFGFLTGVAISKNPTLNISSRSDNYKAIAQAIREKPPVNLEFLGMPLGSREKDSRYIAKVTTDDARSLVNIDFQPEPSVAGDSVDSTAFVLGVQTEYPCAKQHFSKAV